MGRAILLGFLLSLTPTWSYIFWYGEHLWPG